MAVLKDKRDLSPTEYYNTALMLRKEIEDYLFREFATKRSNRDLKVLTDKITEQDAGIINHIINDYNINHSKIVKKTAPEWYAREEQVFLLTNIREAIKHIVMAKSIIVNKNTIQSDIVLQRNHQLEAIGLIQDILEEIKELQFQFHGDLNTIKKLIELAEKEIILLKSWSQTSLKFLK